MKVILLCAGYATRLYPLTENQPKALLPIQGKPMLNWILEKLLPIQEIDGVYVISNDRFAKHFETWASQLRLRVPVKVINDHTTSNETRLGAIGDLQFLLKQEKITEEDLLVVAGDNLFDFNMLDFSKYCFAHRPYPVIAIYDVHKKELAKKYGLVECSSEGQVKAFYEKPENPVTTLASCGIYWLPKETRSLIDLYLKQGNNPDQPGHYMKWLAGQTKLFGMSLQGTWFDIGDLASYEQANQSFQK